MELHPGFPTFNASAEKWSPKGRRARARRHARDRADCRQTGSRRRDVRDGWSIASAAGVAFAVGFCAAPARVTEVHG